MGKMKKSKPAKLKLVAFRLDENLARAFKSKVAQRGVSVQSVLGLSIKNYLSSSASGEDM
jgi:hypothetical protein